MANAASREERPVDASPQRLPRQANAASALFHRLALDAYDAGEPVTRPLLIDDVSTWTLLSFCAALLLGGLSIASFGSVQLSSQGRAVLRSSEGVRSVAALTGGIVNEVHVSIGQTVKEGQVLARIDTTDLQAEVLGAEVALADLRRRQAEEDREDAVLFESAQKLLVRRAKLTSQRIRVQREELRRLRRKHRSLSELGGRGLVALREQDDVTGVVSEGEQARLSLEDALADSLGRQTALRRERALRLSEQHAQLHAAEARLETAKLRLSQTTLRAPADGVVETMLIATGDRVDAGAVILRLAPEELPTQVIAFLPERDRAFMREGSLARLEVDRLPVGEFGSISARVVRVARELAPAQEISRILGASDQAQALVRVDLVIADPAQHKRLAPYLRSGTLMSARIPLRERRIIGLVFDPIRRWLDS